MQKTWLNRKICKWYMFTLGLIVMYYLGGLLMNNNTYYNPNISIIIRVIELIDLLIIPLIYEFISIRNDEIRLISKILLYLASVIGMLILFIIIIISLSFFEKDILYGDIKYNSNGKIIVEHQVWLENNLWIDTYESKGILFLELSDSSKSVNSSYDKLYKIK